MHDLFEELDAWNPAWREDCRSVLDAARAAGPVTVALYSDWIRTEDGANYERLMGFVPDYLGAIRASQDSIERLPVAVATLKD